MGFWKDVEMSTELLLEILHAESRTWRIFITDVNIVSLPWFEKRMACGLRHVSWWKLNLGLRLNTLFILLLLDCSLRVSSLKHSINTCRIQSIKHFRNICSQHDEYAVRVFMLPQDPGCPGGRQACAGVKPVECDPQPPCSPQFEPVCIREYCR